MQDIQDANLISLNRLLATVSLSLLGAEPCAEVWCIANILLSSQVDTLVFEPVVLSLDKMLSKLPWGIGIIALPWLPGKLLRVDWSDGLS
ncbi:MAG: hypothetical protein AAFP10_02655 [Pseudomonadota bacterium]